MNMQGNNKVEQPKFRHHPGEATFLGHYKGCDLYVVTSALTEPSLVIRFGGEIGDYTTWSPHQTRSVVSFEHTGAFPEAFARARTQGFYQEFQIKNNDVSQEIEHFTVAGAFE